MGRARHDRLIRAHASSEPAEPSPGDTVLSTREPQPILEDGALISGRYRIIAYLARGSFGEVYRAVDEILGAKIALKILRRDVARDPSVTARFKREIHLARKVTHRNVCRIFDLGVHEESLYLTMELLEGETLEERILGRGPFLIEEARPIVEQIASALTAAHEAGVIHRDLKPSNVVLTVDAQGSLRVVVTDFGLALSVEPDRRGEAGGALRLTAAGAVVGSPLYMAPEQVAGCDVTPKSDLYALGLVMYEMITGERAFEGGSPFSAAVRRLRELPPPPRTLVEGLDPRWDAAVMRCLRFRPEERPRSAAEICEALADYPVFERTGGPRATQGPSTAVDHAETRLVDPPARSTARKVERAGFVVAVLIGAVLGVCTAYGLHLRSMASRRSLPTVAVVGFENASGRKDDAWIATALSEMLTAELSADDRIRVISGESVSRAKRDLSIGEDGPLAGALQRIHENLGTDFLIVGSFAHSEPGDRTGGRLRVDVALQDKARGTLVSATAESDAGSILDLGGILSAKLRPQIEGTSRTAQLVGPVRTGLPGNTAAARLYAEGLSALRAFELRPAIASLEQAKQADPSSPLVHEALADALRRAGFERRAAEEAGVALEKAAGCQRRDRLEIEARRWETERRFDRAAEKYRSLWEFYPEEIEYGIRLAEAQIAQNAPKDALATVEALRGLRPPESNDPRISLVESQALYLRSGAQVALRPLDAARSEARARGAQSVLAEIEFRRAVLLLVAGETERALAAAEEAKNIFSSARDRGGELRVLTLFAEEHRRAGRLSRAENTLHAVEKMAKDIGMVSMLIEALLDRALIDKELGRASEALLALDEARPLADAGGPFEQVFLRTTEAQLLIAAGELGRADEVNRDMLRIARASEDPRFIAAALGHSAYLALYRDDLVSARALGEEALHIREKLGVRPKVLECVALLAKIALEDGRCRDAEQLLKTAHDGFVEAKRIDRAAAMATELANLELLRKDADAADRALPAFDDEDAVESVPVRIGLHLAEAQMTALLGGRDARREAIEQAKRAGEAAVQGHLVPEAFEAELVLGKLERRRARLENVAKEARAKGFLLYERKAKDALAKLPVR